MSSALFQWFSRLSIRVRLAIAYILTLGVILIVFAVFIYFQLQRNLIRQVDTALALAAAQAVGLVDTDEPVLLFEELSTTPNTEARLDDFSVHLLDKGGTVVDTMGGEEDVSVLQLHSGTQTVLSDGIRWRVHIEALAIPERQFEGWVQTAQTLDPVDRALSNLRTQLIIGIPLALLLASLGGLYLAVHALKPINQITQTAKVINETDLAMRINYDGPADEVGQLAATFDQMLERLDAAFQRQLRFTADAAHELRTPLSALKARIGVTLSQPREPVYYVNSLQDMEEQVDRLTRLSRELLYLARMDQGDQIHFEVIELAELMETLLDILSPLVEEKSISLQCDIASGVTVNANMDLLIQLFLNLLDNALKYTPAQGNVTIKGLKVGAESIISINDTGPGIAAEHLPHLFERFYRVDAGRAHLLNGNAPGGSGLGLAIAYEIVQMHKGSIEVESTLGKGTTFTVHLPTGLKNEATI